jgi:2-polyprenyl-3-methyl-5-hydroxy-6-metoxy-1,4-benzoquinol methylase
VGEAVVDVLARVGPAVDDDGFDYFRYHLRRYRFTLEKIAGLAAGRSLRILDVGCFPPYLSQALQQMGHRVSGVSSEHESVETADVEVLNIETDRFPWDDDAFDLVIFAEVVEHLVQSPVPPLREMRRVAAPGGHVFVSTPNIASARHRLQLLAGHTIMFPIDDYFRDDGRGCSPYHRHNKEYTLRELTQVVGRTGWDVVDSGYFMAYPGSFGQDAQQRRTRMLAPLKVAAHRVIPGAEDTIYTIGRKA